MLKDDLKKDIDRFNDEEEKQLMSRDEKKVIQKAKLGAFKVWKHQRMGNGALFSAVVKYGFFDAVSFVDFIKGFEKLKDEQRKSGDPHPTAEERENLRSKALDARANLKIGKRCSGLRKLLSAEEAKWSAKHISGELEREVHAANKAYGHGQGVTTMAAKDVAVYRNSHPLLDRYWETIDE